MQSNWCLRWMRHGRFILLLACIGTLSLSGIIEGQDKKQVRMPQTTLNYVMPMGGKAGTSVEIVLTGADLDEAEGLLFSHPGIKAEKVAEPAPPPPDPKKPAAKMPAQAPANTAAKFKVNIAPDTPLGIHDVRILNRFGVSNPRAFVVGDQNEITEKEGNNDIPEAQKIELNTTINGAIAAPVDVDYFAFTGKKGQRVVLSCLAASIDSRLNPVVELYNAAGQRLATNRNYNDTDAVTDAILPADAEYFVRVFQFTHVAGNPEYFYRLTVSTAPWIDAAFPAVVEAGKPTQVTLYGRNLPGGQPDPTATAGVTVLEKATVTVNLPADPKARQRLAYSGYLTPVNSGIDGFDYRVKNASGSSNPAFLAISQAPVVLDNGKNGTRETAQEVKAPCEIAGGFGKGRDQSWYVLDAKAGQVYSVEAQSDRLNSPTDLVVTLYGADGKQVLAELDDDNDSMSNQFFTRSSDPARYRLQVPADGKYLILVKNQGSMGSMGPRAVYRVRVTPEQPDFRLILMPPRMDPEGNLLFQGGNQEYVVYVWRQDGFNAPVTLTAENLPPGLTCKPQIVGSGQRLGSLIVSAADNAAPWTGEIKVQGKASINGQEVVREARSASIVWGIPNLQPNQNVAMLARLDRGVVLAVREKAPFALNAKDDEPLTAQLGTKIKVPVKFLRHWPDAKVPINVVVANLPPNVAFNGKNAPLAVAADKGDAELELDIQANAVPGTYSVVFRGTGLVPYAKDPKGQKGPVTITQPSTAVVLRILPKTVANFSVDPAQQLKAGSQAELIVKVQRLFEFDGEFKVELVESGVTKGLSIPATNIPAGKNEAKVPLVVAADAPPGPRPNVTLKATAMIDGKIPAVHEAKVNLNVAK